MADHDDNHDDPVGKKIRSHAKSLQVGARLPTFRTLCLTLAFVFGALYFVVPMTSPSPFSWTSGPISKPHQFIAHDCKSCHIEPFQKVSDTTCTTCHKLSAHAVHFESKTHFEEGACIECHKEHKGGQHPTVSASKLCTDCHGEIKKEVSASNLSNVPSLAKHPEIRVSIPKEDKIIFTSINEASDPTPLKFNHKIHLKGPLDGKEGPVRLECKDCHEGKGLMSVAQFDKNCRTCHSLEFDTGLPGVEVPHGDPAAVYYALVTAYTRLALYGTASPPPDLRPIPGRAMTGEMRASIEKNARDAEDRLYTKTACSLCHMTSKLPTPSESSQFEIEKVKIPTPWMRRASFSHASHELYTCESCHKNSRNSEKTTDINLPKIESCKNCHTDPASNWLAYNHFGKVESDCVMCHSYHDELALPKALKRKIQ